MLPVLLAVVRFSRKKYKASDSFFNQCHQERFTGVFKSLLEARANKNLPTSTDKEKQHQFKHFCISDYTPQTPPGTIPMSLTLDGILCVNVAGSSAMSYMGSF